MSGNTFGKLFTVTTFGESHGEALGCIIDGCPPGLALSASDLQPDLNRRKPGQSRYTTQRREDDEVDILLSESTVMCTSFLTSSMDMPRACVRKGIGCMSILIR